MLLISGTGVTFCHLALAIFFYFQENNEENVKSLGWLPITALTFFIIFYASGLGPVPFAVVGEILPTDIKGKAAGFNMFACSITIFLVTKFFPSLVKLLGSGSTFLLFAVLGAIGTILVFIFVPETKGKTLVEIQKMLEKKFSFW
jgi:MFS family permease